MKGHEQTDSSDFSDWLTSHSFQINGKTDEKFTFEIVGVGEEPLPGDCSAFAPVWPILSLSSSFALSSSLTLFPPSTFLQVWLSPTFDLYSQSYSLPSLTLFPVRPFYPVWLSSQFDQSCSTSFQVWLDSRYKFLSALFLADSDFLPSVTSSPFFLPFQSDFLQSDFLPV